MPSSNSAFVRKAKTPSMTKVFFIAAGETGDDDDRDICGGRILLQVLEHLLPAKFGQQYVEQNYIGQDGLNQF
jgi:hypothetical protein